MIFLKKLKKNFQKQSDFRQTFSTERDLPGKFMILTTETCVQTKNFMFMQTLKIVLVNSVKTQWECITSALEDTITFLTNIVANNIYPSKQRHSFKAQKEEKLFIWLFCLIFLASLNRMFFFMPMLGISKARRSLYDERELKTRHSLSLSLL